DDDDLASERRWLASFEGQRGRPLRVLHVGNIANNAFMNASLMRREGVDADVIAYDYYDPMATPEWESAARKPWFVQGPLRLSMRYLAARFDGKRIRAALAWWSLWLARALNTDPDLTRMFVPKRPADASIATRVRWFLIVAHGRLRRIARRVYRMRTRAWGW